MHRQKADRQIVTLWIDRRKKQQTGTPHTTDMYSDFDRLRSSKGTVMFTIKLTDKQDKHIYRKSNGCIEDID